MNQQIEKLVVKRRHLNGLKKKKKKQFSLTRRKCKTK